jgi:ClpP class serine protease
MADSGIPPVQDDAARVAGKVQPTLMLVINELNVNADQLQKRQACIAEIEKVLSQRYSAANRMFSYISRFGHPRAGISSADIPILDSILNSISGAEQINLLLHSHGGDGTIVEKMVDMCRAHLSGNNRKLRVIVPNLAKSAATVMTLGADTIVMGYCSELGPIDPQLQIIVSGVAHWISALSFVETRDSLMKQIADAIQKNEPTQGLMQQLAGLNIPFTREMEHVIGFANMTAKNLLTKYMLKPTIKKKTERDDKAHEIAEKLLSKQLFPVHGQFIDGLRPEEILA